VKLVRLARHRWDVLAILDARERCEILEFLTDPEESYRVAAQTMLRTLFEAIPGGGPPKAEPLGKSLGNGLFELRKQPKGKKLRVVWFYGGGAVVVCVVAFTKAERTPRSKLAQALLLRERYQQAKADQEIKIVEIEETVWKYLKT
jgi:phage-related protein